MAVLDPIETHQYTKGRLTDEAIGDDPVAQFTAWFDEAKSAGIVLPEAVSLATAELPSGKVSDRIVLMKSLEADGRFTVYSNWGCSHKAKDFATNPHVSLLFWWKEQERMVRVEGTGVRMSTEESQVYFQQRPRGSQIGAWVSQQSVPIASRKELDDKYEAFADKHPGNDPLPCPPYWGGIRITPERWEFWQGGSFRIHDRFQFTRAEPSEPWKRERICP